MDFSSIFSAILAGGLAGQIVTLVWGNSLSEKREFNKWLTEEKFKLYSEFLSLIAHSPKDKDSLQYWHFDIRNLSQRIFLLFPKGNPPGAMARLMEEIFQLAKRKKDGEWNDQLAKAMREVVRSIRAVMAEDLHNH